jgi:hypothetical protein
VAILKFFKLNFHTFDIRDHDEDVAKRVAVVNQVVAWQRIRIGHVKHPVADCAGCPARYFTVSNCLKQKESFHIHLMTSWCFSSSIWPMDINFSSSSSGMQMSRSSSQGMRPP